MSEIRTTTQIAEEARDLLTAPVWEYIAGGAESEATIWRNREAINSYVFISRVLRDVSKIDASTIAREYRAKLDDLAKIHDRHAMA